MHHKSNANGGDKKGCEIIPACKAVVPGFICRQYEGDAVSSICKRVSGLF